ncbi:MAG: hypothetical protein CL866_10110 [Cycloclasticus sp.]|nr:hypothetical protein [Cycloclasticus sp.]MBG97197.1 hypothetical protein [Cycloclasticus sp.]|tara:strand:+ start:1002 stop:1964 length:963 start_codon:yes stop_codon:yes gene_type:complete
MNKLELLKSRINGPVFSVMTPFKEVDDEIDYLTLECYLRKIFDDGGKIFYVMGYNSRFSELSWQEIRELNKFVVDTVKALDEDNIVIVADPLHCSTRVSIDFARHAEKIGADMISLVFREKFYSNEQVYKHYLAIAESTDIGILVHEMPFISGHGGHTVNWPVELLDSLAGIENVIAIKEDAKDDVYSHEVISTIKDRVAIIISGGGKRQWLEFSNLGCQAWLNGIGVFEPKLAVVFWRAKQENNMSKCMEIIEKIEVPFFDDVVSKFGWHLGIKAALQARGIMSRYERMPLLAIDDNQYKEVEELMKRLPIDEILVGEF